MAYSLWLPKRSPAPGGVLILHGAGSCKESHHDFARAVQAAGLAALAFDQRGHGASEGQMGGEVLEDIAHMAALLRSHLPGDAIALRGSSMGGCLSILAAPDIAPVAVVAICPASTGGMRRWLQAGDVPFRADTAALDSLLARVDLPEAIASCHAPLLLLHAEGDEQVPVQHSRELATHMRSPDSRLITLPGGHHRSIQHDPELQAVSLRFIEKAVAAGPS